MFVGIQLKVGGFLALVLVAVLAVGTCVSTLQATRLLQRTADSAGRQLERAAFEEAQSVFSSLQIGTSRTIQRGEMDGFHTLLAELGQIPNIREIGLSDAKGRIDFSNQPGSIGKGLEDATVRGALEARGTKVFQSRSGDFLLLARAQVLQERCLECHPGTQVGDIAGILYSRYDLGSLGAAERAMAAQLAEATRDSIISGVATGAGGLILALAGIYVLLGRLVRRPLGQVQGMMVELERGHLTRRLDMPATDEIGQTAAAMDRLAESLQRDVVVPLQRLANGDLTFTVTPKDGEDVIRGALKKMGEDLSRILAQVKVAGEQIATGSTQVADSSQALSSGATEQASSLEEISASVHELAAQTRQNAENATNASHFSAQARDAARTGSDEMGQMMAAMGQIDEAGRNMSKIIKVIDEIAFQTNLLALNAAVEAARAGRHGKGFAVVAEEVRNLAARSAKAARETTDLIECSVERANAGVRLARDTAEGLEKIVAGVTQATDLIAEIAAASNEQAQGISQINIGLEQIGQVTTQNSAAAEQSATAVQILAGQAEELRRMLAPFKLRDSGVPVAVAAPVSAPAAVRTPAPPSKPVPPTPVLPVPASAKPCASQRPTIVLDDHGFGKY